MGRESEPICILLLFLFPLFPPGLGGCPELNVGR